MLVVNKGGSIPYSRLFPKEGCIMEKMMKVMIDGIAYTAAMPENTVTDILCHHGPIELQLKRYADQEYYAPLTNPLPFSSIPLTTSIKTGGLYYYEGFGVFAISFVDAKLGLYKAVHLGDI